MNSISKNSAITFSSQILIFASGFITLIILARTLGPSGKGIYTLIILIPTVMLKLGSLGIEVANVYFIGSKQYEPKEVVSNSLLSSILLGLLLILLFLGISRLNVFKNYLDSNQINIFYLWLVILTVPFSLLSGFLRNIFLGKEKIITFNKINIFQTIMRLVIIVIFLVILRQGVSGAINAYIITILSVFVFIIFLIKKITEIKYSFNRKLFKDFIGYGVKAYFANLTQFLNYRLDMFLVAFFLTPAAVGYYSITVGIAEKLWMLPGAIATVLFPRISSLQDKDANNLTPRVARHTFFIIFIFSLMLVILIRPLIKILFGIAFLPSVKPLLILLPGIVALGGAKTLTADLAGRGKPQFAALASFVSLAVNIPLNLWLIPKWGIAGAAFASSVAYIIATIVVVIAFLKISDKLWADILLIKKQDFQDYKKFLLKVRTKILKRAL